MSREEKFKSIITNIDKSEYNKDERKKIQSEIKTYKSAKSDWISSKYSQNKFSSYKPFQFVDGEGVRCSLYVSGCLFACKDCFNASIQNFHAGELYTKDVEKKIIDDLSKSYVQGLTLLGGEPFLNTKVCISLCKKVREVFGDKKDIWVYSGFTYEQLLNGSADKLELLNLCDILVDGPFMCELKDLSLSFRGSSNQRIIDIKRSKKEDIVIYIN